MSDVNINFAIRTIPLVGSGSGNPWTAIVTPIDCSRIVIRNGDGTNALLLRTDPNDGTTQDSLPASSEYTIQITAVTTYFKNGTTVCYVKPAAPGDNSVIGKFYR